MGYEMHSRCVKAHSVIPSQLLHEISYEKERGALFSLTTSPEALNPLKKD